MPDIDTTTIVITNGINVVVPESPCLMTHYILQEQGDWFEDEINFVRHFIKPGMKAIDIGANYGLYALSIATIIGESGKLWAFEPTQATSDCLRKSISSNNLNNIMLIQSALSNKTGQAKFYTAPNAEINSLSSDATPGHQHETILLMTLDQCLEKYKWEDIDFIKLDAEGEEGNILKKGKTALSKLTPLIMYELKHGRAVNISLINRFKSLGYESYYLVPGLNVLVSFDHNKPVDGFLLNIFCCKKDREIELERDGIIVKNWSAAPVVDVAVVKQYVESQAYAPTMADLGESVQHDDADGYLTVMALYIVSMSEEEDMSKRVSCLMGALEKLKKMISSREQSVERLCTFARIAFFAGERKLGVDILTSLYNRYSSNMNFEIIDLFFPASTKYDTTMPRGSIKDWLFASVIEELIEKHNYSTYFTRNQTKPLFDQLNSLGYMDEMMEKRYRLMMSCFS